MSGIGIFKSSNGNTYIGEHSNGTQNGYGILKSKNNVNKGQFVNGKLHGLGIQNDDIYGLWENDILIKEFD